MTYREGEREEEEGTETGTKRERGRGKERLLYGERTTRQKRREVEWEDGSGAVLLWSGSTA